MWWGEREWWEGGEASGFRMQLCFGSESDVFAKMHIYFLIVIFFEFFWKKKTKFKIFWGGGFSPWGAFGPLRGSLRFPRGAFGPFGLWFFKKN